MPNLFNFESNPDPYGVMGNPISHSRSPHIHRLFAQQTNQSIIYDAIHVDVGGFQQAVGNFMANGGKGLNITVPFKPQAFALVDLLSESAQLAAAVNTILLKPDGNLYGDNTDGIGLVRDLKDNYRIILSGKTILVLGAGGATRGIIQPLLKAAVAEIIIVNRTLQKAMNIVAQFHSAVPELSSHRLRAMAYSDLSEKTAFDIIINATSASLANELPPLPSHLLYAPSCCYDMMYASTDTIFMQWSKRCGVTQVF
ncbi:MAG: shikimate dehydrogenase, partial [Thiohalomonadales bacterium]